MALTLTCERVQQIRQAKDKEGMWGMGKEVDKEAADRLRSD